MKGEDFTRGVRLPRLLLEEPNVKEGGNQKAFQESFGMECHTQDVLIIIPFAPDEIVGVHALQRRF